MKKMLSLALMISALSGCSLFQIHKLGVQQGNILTEQDTSRIHKGMSKAQVEDILGAPLLVNLFSPQRLEYVYTMQEGHGDMHVTRVSYLFVNGRLVEISRKEIS